MVWRRKQSSTGASSSPGGRGAGAGAGEEEKVPRGHVPMVAGGGGEGDEFKGERVMVPVRLLSDPCIAELLDMAAQRYGYGQPGVLRIPCDAGTDVGSAPREACAAAMAEMLRTDENRNEDVHAQPPCGEPQST